MILLTNKALAYINWGRWIADCPADCGGALSLEPAQSILACPECHQISEIDWPSDADGIWEELTLRPVPRTRNWFPVGHPLALRAGCAHGQTVADLRDETAAHGDG